MNAVCYHYLPSPHSKTIRLSFILGSSKEDILKNVSTILEHIMKINRIPPFFLLSNFLKPFSCSLQTGSQSLGLSVVICYFDVRCSQCSHQHQNWCDVDWSGQP